MSIIVSSGIMAHVNVSRANILLSLDIIGIDVNVLNGRRTVIMFNPERTCCWRNSIQYIRREFELQYPDGDREKLDKILSSYSEDDVIRVANAISRFGLSAILDVIDSKEHKHV